MLSAAILDFTSFTSCPVNAIWLLLSILENVCCVIKAEDYEAKGLYRSVKIGSALGKSTLKKLVSFTGTLEM